MTMLVAGVDSSTQSCTVVLRDADSGTTVAVASAPHPQTTPPISEQDPVTWWKALQQALGGTGMPQRHIAALSVDAQAHGLVPLDAGQRLIRPAKLWNDTTSVGDARALVSQLGAETWVRRTGSVPPGAFTISKVRWLARNEPDNFGRLRHLLLPHDWLTYRLTDDLVTDPGDASGTGYYNPIENRWDPDLLRLIDPDVDWQQLLPRLVGPNEPAGRLTRAAAAELGLVESLPIGPGTADNQAAAIGMGILAGDVVISLGTSGVVYARSDTPIVDLSGATNGNADATGKYLPVVCTLNAAKVTDTFARLLNVSHQELASLALAAPVTDARRPVLAAFLDGERVPDRPYASGTLTGLRTDTTREQIARAAFEGVLAGLVKGLRHLESLGIPTDGRLALTGGAARSPAYRQLLADLTQRAVYVVDQPETAASGAAVQAAAVLHGTTVADVAQQWTPTWTEVAQPRAGTQPDLLLERFSTTASWAALEQPNNDSHSEETA
jgi:xylulokinase